MSVPRPNPISAIQDRFGLSDVDFAQVLDTSVITLRTAKTGRAVYPRAVYDGLETLGFDPESIHQEYQAYRLQARETLLATLDR